MLVATLWKAALVRPASAVIAFSKLVLKLACGDDATLAMVVFALLASGVTTLRALSIPRPTISFPRSPKTLAHTLSCSFSWELIVANLPLILTSCNRSLTVDAYLGNNWYWILPATQDRTG